MLMYLLGASPAVCASFIQGNKHHPLEPMGEDHHSFFLPYATTLRMGDLGYTSNAQAGMDVCYNDLDQYISTLRDAILTPHPAYGQFDLMQNGERAQLNTSLLQIENEYYSPIRPKRVTQSGEAPVVALARKGIEYVEVRCVDINPFTPFGIDTDTMRLIDLFLIACLIDDSPPCDADGQRQNKTNLQRMVNRGREPGLTLLSRDGVETPREVLAEPILDRMDEVAKWYHSGTGNTDYEQVVAQARAHIADPSLTLSARVLDEMTTNNQSFWQLALRYSREWHQQHLAAPLADATWEAMTDDAAISLERQQEIESQDNQSFDTYLSQFYEQYQSV
jgi:glutamate--cysteine ligase